MARQDEPDFRPIQYLGSKWRMLDQISDAVDQVAPQHRSLCVDLFAGTGVVSRSLARSRPVLAADIQEYSRVITSALLNPVKIDAGHLLDAARERLLDDGGQWHSHLIAWEAERARSPERLAHLAADIESGSIRSHDWSKRLDVDPLLAASAAIRDQARWTLLAHYGGVFFSYRQAAELDSIAAAVRNLDPLLTDTALAALLSTASDVVSSVGGHFAQPIAPRDKSGSLKSRVLENISVLRRRSVFTVFEERLARFSNLAAPLHQGTAVRSPFDVMIADLPDHAGVVYADPPYTREHYSRFYHVLETIALGDNPGVSTVKLNDVTQPSRGIYRVDRHQSPFSVVSRAPSAFDLLFSTLAAKEIAVVLSYSPIPKNEKPRARVIDLPSLVDLARLHYKSVDVVEVSGVRHAKFNSAELNAPAVEEAEVLLIATNS